MPFTNEIQLSTANLDDGLHAGASSNAESNIGSKKLCAYNQTRECFLALDVNGADFSSARLRDHLEELTFKSGEGLWLAPFRGLPDAGLRMPLDLLYLDEDCVVIDVVESYPTFRVGSSGPRAYSVLTLPTHSIYSSQTQVGDQLVLCAAHEMEEKLEQLASPVQENSLVLSSQSHNENFNGYVQSAALLREKPLWSGGPGLLELGDRSIEDRPEGEKPHIMGLIQPGVKAARPPKSWLDRWWSPDPRKAPREAATGLAAYYWTGGPAEPHGIRDISSTGLYVVTEERWYPGTLILMTLQRDAQDEPPTERCIAVHSRAVRWGNDGVGLQFVLPKSLHARDAVESLGSAADKKELDRFLLRLQADKR